MTDPFVGQLTFLRVYSGVVKSGDSVLNPTEEKKKGLGVFCRCTPTIARDLELMAGDIAAAVVKGCYYG